MGFLKLLFLQFVLGPSDPNSDLKREGPTEVGGRGEKGWTPGKTERALRLSLWKTALDISGEPLPSLAYCFFVKAVQGYHCQIPLPAIYPV